MKKYRLQNLALILCLTAMIHLTIIVKAQETTTATPIPTIVMSSKDNTAEVTPMMDMAGMGTSDTAIRFAARVSDKEFACGMTYDGLGSDTSSVQVSDFRFYVSNVKLIDADKKEVPLELEQDGLWQYKNVALLDFEDGSAGCGDGGNELLHTKVTGAAPVGSYTGIVFDLGVPYELNHLDISTAQSPLNLDAMWWGWQSGFKFVRIDMMANGNPYFIHLGSTGCASANETTAPEQPCTHSNRLTVRMDGFDPTKNFVVADLASLVNGIKLSDSEPRPPGCMSGPDDSDCKALFPNLGLELESGNSLSNMPQSFFRIG